MIDQYFFSNEDRAKSKRQANSFSRTVSMILRGIEDIISKISKSSVFSVKISEDVERDRLLEKISESSSQLLLWMKSQSNGSPQRIGIKTPDLVTLNKNIEDILKRIEAKELKMVIPDTQKVTGEVKVNNFPEQYDFNQLYFALKEMSGLIGKIKVEFPKIPEVRMPDIKIPEFPKSISLQESAKIIDSLNAVQEAIQKIPKPKEVNWPSSISVNNFPPQKYPMPVTHISINALNGTIKSTSVTVTTDLTVLPPEVLANRRSLLIFNNSSATTVYIGGSTMSASAGLHVLAQTYSPVFDASSSTILYGRTSNSTAEIRVLEISDEASGR